ncbi:MAG TPA: hypothetical protein VHB79_10815 [Polyangiaceae bacterium]|nr:hypothetical protein [Polyangiaceae bacterium]
MAAKVQRQPPVDCSSPGASFEPVVLINPGQSNATGADRKSLPAGIPDASIPEWLDDLYYKDGAHAFGPLRTSPHGAVFSHEVALALRLQAAGFHPAVIKITKGGSYSNRWTPPGAPGSAAAMFYPELSEALAALPAQFPCARHFRFVVTWDQGESEARSEKLEVVMAWPKNFVAIKNEIWARVHAQFADAVLLEPFVVRTYTHITGATFPDVFPGLQASVVSAPNHLIDSDDVGYRNDGVHRLGSGQIIIGNRIADVAIGELRALR